MGVLHDSDTQKWNGGRGDTSLVDDVAGWKARQLRWYPSSP